ncbi:MAG: hypothetical protein P8Z31_10810, partial [Gammaproteobacteria bacterium]
ESLRLARRLEPDDPNWTALHIYNLIVLHRYDDAMAEIEDYDGRDQFVAFMRAALGLREHGDLQRTVQDMLAVHEEFGTPTTFGMMIFAHEVGRNFEAAARAAAAIPDSEAQMMRLEIWHFLGEENKVAELAAAAREGIVEPGMEPSEITDGRAIELAMLAATEGDAAAAEQFIRQFYRGEGTDWASRVALRDRTCRILGIAGAADAAVKCIRDGLAEPSRVMPFFEPRLPHYDAIRDEPVFIELVGELGLENMAGP